MNTTQWTTGARIKVALWARARSKKEKNGECLLRCPWHGWDFDPKTGLPPGGHEDSGQTMYPLDVRDDGIYVGLDAEMRHTRPR